MDDVDDEYRRLQDEGVSITTPIETEPWGERSFQVTDPIGVGARRGRDRRGNGP